MLINVEMVRDINLEIVANVGKWKNVQIMTLLLFYKLPPAVSSSCKVKE